MAQSPFEYLNHIRANKPLTYDELKDFNLYLIQKSFYYGGNEMKVNYMNSLWNLPKELQYKIFCSFFKDKQSGWIKKVSQKYNEKKIEEIKQKYKCSKKTAIEYLKMED